MAITTAAIDRRNYCHHHHRVVVINDSSEDTIAYTTSDRHCRKTAIGSVPPPPLTTTTATLTLIALVLTLPRTRIEQRGGGRAVTRLIHRRRCHRCRRHLHLRSQDGGIKEDGCIKRQDSHADIHSREEVGHHKPSAPAPADSYCGPCSTRTPPCTSQLLQDLFVSST